MPEYSLYVLTSQGRRVVKSSDAGDGLAQSANKSAFIFEHAAKVLLTAALLGVHSLPHELSGIYDAYGRGHTGRSAIARRMA
jgi:hypothetical protein